MSLIVWAYAGLIGTIALCMTTAALMIGMPVGGALTISATTATWLIAIPAVIAFLVIELRARR